MEGGVHIYVCLWIVASNVCDLLTVVLMLQKGLQESTRQETYLQYNIIYIYIRSEEFSLLLCLLFPILKQNITPF